MNSGDGETGSSSLGTHHHHPPPPRQQQQQQQPWRERGQDDQEDDKDEEEPMICAPKLDPAPATAAPAAAVSATTAAASTAPPAVASSAYHPAVESEHGNRKGAHVSSSGTHRHDPAHEASMPPANELSQEEEEPTVPGKSRRPGRFTSRKKRSSSAANHNDGDYDGNQQAKHSKLSDAHAPQASTTHDAAHGEHAATQQHAAYVPELQRATSQQQQRHQQQQQQQQQQHVYQQQQHPHNSYSAVHEQPTSPPQHQQSTFSIQASTAVNPVHGPAMQPLVSTEASYFRHPAVASQPHASTTASVDVHQPQQQQQHQPQQQQQQQQQQQAVDASGDATIGDAAPTRDSSDDDTHGNAAKGEAGVPHTRPEGTDKPNDTQKARQGQSQQQQAATQGQQQGDATASTGAVTKSRRPSTPAPAEVAVALPQQQQTPEEKEQGGGRTKKRGRNKPPALQEEQGHTADDANGHQPELERVVEEEQEEQGEAEVSSPVSPKGANAPLRNEKATAKKGKGKQSGQAPAPQAAAAAAAAPKPAKKKKKSPRKHQDQQQDQRRSKEPGVDGAQAAAPSSPSPASSPQRHKHKPRRRSKEVQHSPDGQRRGRPKPTATKTPKKQTRRARVSTPDLHVSKSMLQRFQSEAACKIQAAYRGYRTRKTIKWKPRSLQRKAEEKKEKERRAQEEKEKRAAKRGRRRKRSSVPAVFVASDHGLVDQAYVDERFEVYEKLGDGNFADVYRCCERKTGTAYALKIVYKNRLVGKRERLMIENEVKIMREINHPHIIKLYDVLETEDRIFLVLELVHGGDLFDRIVERGRFTEADAQQLVRHLTQAVAYLHSHRIVHRDLKPENILVAQDEFGRDVLKLGDFGLSMRVEEKIYTICGTPTYVAPEIISEDAVGYGLEVDTWAIGVIMYIMLCGFPPFASATKNQKELFDRIRRGAFSFPDPYWSDVSAEAKALIRNLLRVDPQSRLTPKQILRHRWLQRRPSTAAICVHDRHVPVVEELLKHFPQKKRWSDAVTKMRSTAASQDHSRVASANA